MAGAPDAQIAPHTPSQATRYVLERARELGFDDGVVAPADLPLAHLDEVRAAVEGERLSPFAWMRDTLDKRLDVSAALEGAKSVVVLVTNYHHGDHADHVEAARVAEGAKVSRYAWGSDYHNVMRKRLAKLRKGLLAHFPEARIAPFTDAQPVLERAWAQAAGLGFVGKSTMFIHRGFGTWTFLSGLVTDIELETTVREPQTDLCGTCTRCLDACPTQAFVGPFELDARRCLSTWTVEYPTSQEADAPDFAGHGWALGCDVCQEVCPWNRFAQPSREARFAPREGHVVLTPQTVPEDLAGSPMARAKAEGMKRNVARALANPQSRD